LVTIFDNPCQPLKILAHAEASKSLYPISVKDKAVQHFILSQLKIVTVLWMDKNFIIFINE
jgi:hypothetical protein